MSKADKRESKDNPNKRSSEVSGVSRSPQRHNKSHGHGTINQDVEHSNPKWSRVLSDSGVDTGAIKNRESGTIIQRDKNGRWRTISPNEIILTPAQIAAAGAREKEVEQEATIELQLVPTKTAAA